ncbi:hypothetical protein H6F93_20395 [Leptolyngbya sp. FACHB-671]|uniref:hypothetical protein n=1 Tax=unclassified Leptolyngbya TaxID=2650499 RepID=UPI00168367FC|nr:MULTISPECIES: hypothetical protein [unclassified Leptolyngbya]MBD1999754.1 hypothetical protein [Leptolyngbya sp. FACHB-541]MBD2069845.1 hypothetical protein [Leptolyngbya sp. FACHB-671]
MQTETFWQLGSNSPDNASHFATISRWWAELSGKEVTWRQRLIPPNGDLSVLNWETQRFDETILFDAAETRGITLYWRKSGSTDERNTTPHKLALDHLHQRLYVFPRSQQEVVIQIGVPEEVYRSLVVTNPQIERSTSGKDQILTLKDDLQQLEIKISLGAENFEQLKRLLRVED